MAWNSSANVKVGNLANGGGTYVTYPNLSKWSEAVRERMVKAQAKTLKYFLNRLRQIYKDEAEANPPKWYERNHEGGHLVGEPSDGEFASDDVDDVWKIREPKYVANQNTIYGTIYADNTALSHPESTIGSKITGSHTKSGAYKLDSTTYGTGNSLSWVHGSQDTANGFSRIINVRNLIDAVNNGTDKLFGKVEPKPFWTTFQNEIRRYYKSKFWEYFKLEK